MSEIFLKEDIASLLDNRFIVIIGDSIQRGVYKDMVLLLQKNMYLTDSMLRAKGEMSFMGDKLIEGGVLGEMSNGVKYREVRQYQTDYHLLRFYFVTRCYNSYVESILTDLSSDPRPDVLMMNSCLWDISRYGNSGVAQYKTNVKLLFKRFKEVLPPTSLVIWNSTMPISKKARGGFLIPAIEFMNSTLRLDILEANFYIHKMALSSGFNVLDLHYFLRHQLQRRAGDGVHWDMTAHRRITNLILTHIAQAWDVKPPQHTRQLLFQNDNQVLSKVFNNVPQAGPVFPDNMNAGHRYMSPLNFNFCHNENNNFNTQAARRPLTHGHNQQPLTHGHAQQPLTHGHNQQPVTHAHAQHEWEEIKRQEAFVNKYGGPIRQPNYNLPTENRQPVYNMPQENPHSMQFGQLVSNQYTVMSNEGQFFSNCRSRSNSPQVNQGHGAKGLAIPGLDQFLSKNANIGQLPSSRGQYKWTPYDQKEFEPPSSRGRMYSDRVSSDRADPYASRERKQKHWEEREKGGFL